MFDPGEPERELFRQLMALHKYFLNADFLRNVFMRRMHREQSPSDVHFAISMDDMIALSLWYATVYVVIEGWREAQLTDPELDALLADNEADDLRRFRNQVFHYQREYDNPRLLEFLGANEADAQAATDWIRRTHAALGRAIETAVENLLDNQRCIELTVILFLRSRTRPVARPKCRRQSGRFHALEGELLFGPSAGRWPSEESPGRSGSTVSEFVSRPRLQVRRGHEPRKPWLGEGL